MSQEINNINIIEQTIDETTIEVVAPPPTPEPEIKRGRGRPKGSIKTENIKTDADYFKRYYLEKTKPNMKEMIKKTCEFCLRELNSNKIPRHQRTARFCLLIQQCTKKEPIVV